MNSNVQAEIQNQVGSYLNPLIISGVGIVCSCLALATYHFILFRFCVRDQRELQHSPSSPQDISLSYGVDPDILNKIPILCYSPNKSNTKFRLDQNECAICLGELEHGDKLRLLPSCNHAFHIPCIDLWFSQHSNCPVCRTPITLNPTLDSHTDHNNINIIATQQGRHDHHTITPIPSPPPPSLSRQPPLLHHSLSLASYTEQIPQHQQLVTTAFNRSLSMDRSSYVSISIQRDQQENPSTSSSLFSSSSSSAHATGDGISHHGKAISPSHAQLDHVSSMLVTSLSQLRNIRSQTSEGILPK